VIDERPRRWLWPRPGRQVSRWDRLVRWVRPGCGLGLAEQRQGLGGLGEDADGFGAAHIHGVVIALPGEDVGDASMVAVNQMASPISREADPPDMRSTQPSSAAQKPRRWGAVPA
jgi:hypothetical protein